jgi:general secretion pathway protein G
MSESRNRKRGARRRRGVTLIEMLVVVTIIALFAAVATVKLWPQADKARVTAARTQIEALLNAVQLAKLETGTFPSTEEGLASVRKYLGKDIPNDPWGHPYVYRFPGEHGEDPEIISYGADGQPGGEGINADIVSWKGQ